MPNFFERQFHNNDKEGEKKKQTPEDIIKQLEERDPIGLNSEHAEEIDEPTEDGV